MAVTITPQIPKITCDPAGVSHDRDIPEMIRETLSKQEARKKLNNEEALDIIVKAARSAIGDIATASRQKQNKKPLPKAEVLPR